jgi:hypothetical protein
MSWKISTRGIPQSITGVAPTLDYRFAIDRNEIDAISLTDKLTYTGGNGTFVGSDGFIQPATTNVPRFDHDPVSRQSLGLLSEESRENYHLFSEAAEQSTAFSGKINCTVIPNAVLAPDGTATADTVVVTTTASSDLRITRLAPTGATSNTFSVFVKTGTNRYVALILRDKDNAANFVSSEFDLVTGIVSVAAQNGGTATGATANIVGYADGWYRISIAGLVGGTDGVTVILTQRTNSNTNSANAGSTISVWGTQLEVGSTASTYIPTTSAAVTRTADSAVIDGTGVITGTYTLVEKPAGCAVVSGTNIELQPGFRAERIAVFPAALTGDQITAIRAAM